LPPTSPLVYRKTSTSERTEPLAAHVDERASLKIPEALRD
jgi:hypothetical protein